MCQIALLLGNLFLRRESVTNQYERTNQFLIYNKKDAVSPHNALHLKDPLDSASYINAPTI